LLETIEQKLSNPERLHADRNQTLPEFLSQHRDEVAAAVLRRMKADPRLSKIPLSDQDRLDQVEAVLTDLLVRLQSESPEGAANRRASAGARHGLARKRQGYSLSMLVDDTRAIDAAVYEVVRDNLLDLDVSTLLQDLSRFNDSLERELQQSLQAFIGERAA